MNKKIKTLEIKLSKLLQGGLFGNYRTRLSGAGMEFDEHKNYSFGDPVKDIDWKASSKTNNLYVKKYELERDLSVLFMIDKTESMNFGAREKTKLETLSEVFYSLGFSAYLNNDSIGALLFDEKKSEFVDYNKNKFNIYKIFEKISPPLTPPPSGEGNSSPQPSPKREGVKRNTLPPEGGELEGGLEEIKNKKIKNNLIFILTDKQNFDEKLLKVINRDNEIIIINIFDNFENNITPPLERGIFPQNFSFDLGKSFLNIDLGDTKKIEEFKKIREKKLAKLKYDLEKNNIGYIKIDDKTDIFRELSKFFTHP